MKYISSKIQKVVKLISNRIVEMGSYGQTDMDDSDKQEERKATNIFVWLVLGILLVTLSYSVLLAIITSLPIKVDIGDTGTFGDSFGILTSLFSGVAFAGLIWTILLQRAELRLQRTELNETRRQAILTRLMTVTQNQIDSYRTEIAPLKFDSIVKPTERIGTGEMIFTIIAHLDQVAQQRQKDKTVGGEFITDFLLYIAKGMQSYQAMIQGLERCCNSNRLLLTNESITSDEAQDLKSHMFSELPTGMMTFVERLHTVLKAFRAQFKTEALSTEKLFDPVRGLEKSCGRIISHQQHQFTEENMAHDREHKYMYR